MPNRHYTDNPQLKVTSPAKGAPTGARGPRQDGVKEATASWGKLPGKAGMTGWGKGVPKVKTYVKYEGC